LKLRIATRGSALALAQASQVAELLGGAELVEASSDGEPGDKARFVRGVERALLDGEAEIGVHSAKDLPAELPAGLAIAAVPAREDPADAWLGVGSSLDDVPEGARVGTASLRRRAQLLATRPDLRVENLHGNVDTRLRKLADGELDAIVLAVAGLRRLGREAEASFSLSAETMTPAAGQGALVLQIRVSDEAAREAAERIGDEVSLCELTVERAAIARLDADCTTPIGVHARVEGKRVEANAFAGLPDGSEWIRDRVEGEAERPDAVGALLAERLLAAGAREILDRAKAAHSTADGPKTDAYHRESAHRRGGAGG
jgi:hydroxymethylbilane synthase